MAYDKEDLIKKSLTAIKKHKIYFITDLISFLPCSRATFYGLQLDKLDAIKEEIEKQKILLNKKQRNNWFESHSATLQLALYKLTCSDDERKKLSTSFIESKTENVSPDLSELTTDEIKELLDDNDEGKEQKEVD